MVVLILFMLGLIAFDPPIASAAATLEITSKTCDEAKQQAIKGVTGGSQVGTGTNIIDKCIAAVYERLVPGTPVGYGTEDPRNYRCVGKVVKISTNTKGKTTEEWYAAEKVPQGVCVTKYCDAKGVCMPAQLCRRN